MLNTTKSQTEVLKKIFNAYENYIVMSDGQNSQMYKNNIVELIPDLIMVFPSISLLEMEDKFNLFKNIVNKKLEERRVK